MKYKILVANYVYTFLLQTQETLYKIYKSFGA